MSMLRAAGSIEDNVKKLQRRDLTRQDRLATKMVISEQRVLQGTVDALRRCSKNQLSFCTPSVFRCQGPETQASGDMYEIAKQKREKCLYQLSSYSEVTDRRSKPKRSFTTAGAKYS